MAISFPPAKTQAKKQSRISHRELMIIFCAALAIIVHFVFPAKTAGEVFWLNFILFLVFPLLVIRFFLKENFKNLGLTAGKIKAGLIMSALGTIVFSLLLYFLILKLGLRSKFGFYFPIAENFWLFLWFELILVSGILFFREFFFRGFIQLGLEKKFGFYGIALQSLLYSSLSIKSSWMEILLIFALSIFAGITTQRSRSIFYSYFVLWITSVVGDIIIINIIKKGLP